MKLSELIFPLTIAILVISFGITAILSWQKTEENHSYWIKGCEEGNVARCLQIVNYYSSDTESDILSRRLYNQMYKSKTGKDLPGFKQMGWQMATEGITYRLTAGGIEVRAAKAIINITKGGGVIVQ